jgi:CelD/BcsL family acetyltransferase involved in cellulose biosynthesis
MNGGTSLKDLGVRVRSSNTAPITREEYARCYHAWGGSFIVHPEVLQFLEDTYGVKTDYRGYFQQGKCTGAVGAWGLYLAGDHSALRAYKLTEQVDFGYPVLYLPIAPGHRSTVLYRASFLLNLQRRQIAGAVFTRIKRMAILKHIPDELPTGKKEFQIKERRFERLGGMVRDIQEFGNAEIVAMYEELFFLRWNRKPHGIGMMTDTLHFLRKFLFGKVLWLRGRPVAIQINYRAETSRTICVDYVNGGVDKTFNGISPGSLLSYINGREACAEAQSRGKRLIYSYGKANTAYKNQWCSRIARGFTGFWMP